MAQATLISRSRLLRNRATASAAGVTDTVEVVQAQEAVARANETYISSLYTFNSAKISLARAMGLAEQGVQRIISKENKPWHKPPQTSQRNRTSA